MEVLIKQQILIKIIQRGFGQERKLYAQIEPKVSVKN
jgi:hypothetical protein